MNRQNALADEETLGLVRERHTPLEHRAQYNNTDSTQIRQLVALQLEKTIENGRDGREHTTHERLAAVRRVIRAEQGERPLVGVEYRHD